MSQTPLNLSHRPAARLHLLAAAALLLVVALPAAARAQWVTSTNTHTVTTTTDSVGVGTASPGSKLDVSGGNIQISNTDFSSMSFRDGDAILRRHALWISNTNAGGGILGGITNFPAWGAASPTPSALYFVAPYDGNWNQWYPTLTLKGTSVNGGGNVGVGTTSPAARLHVVGTIRANFTDTTTWPAIRGEFKHLGDSGGLTILAQGANGTASGSGDINFATSVSNSADGFTDAPTATRMTIKYNGNVGIGTSTPAGKFEVAGGPIFMGDMGQPGWGNMLIRGRVLSANNNIHLSPPGGTNVYINSDYREAGGATGPVNLVVSGTITGGKFSATYQDVAEWVPSTQKLEAGTVVVLDAGRTNHVMASTKSYDTSVAGVVSDSPGVILGVEGEGKLKVATTGRVKVRADATGAPIRVGDLLVTSEVEGAAMKSVPVDLGGAQIHRPGTLIGKALEPLEKGAGEILVLLSLQ